MSRDFDWTKPVYCHPRIAQIIGFDAGVAYERLRYMVRDSSKKKVEFGCIHEDGRRWVDFSYAQLFAVMPFFKSVKALRDVIGKLEKAGLIESKPLYKGGSKWYTITDLDPETLTQDGTVETDATGQGVRRAESGTMTPQVRDYDATGQGTHIYSNRIISESISESTDSSSSPSPSDSQNSVLLGEKEKVEIIPDLEIENPPLETKTPKPMPVIGNQPMIQALSMTCYGHYNLSAKTITKLAGGAARLLAMGATPSDLRLFADYHTEQNAKRPPQDRHDYPTLDYVLDGWGKFIAWRDQRLDVEVTKFIPGTDFQKTYTRREWLRLEELAIGGRYVVEKWCQDAWADIELIKQPDGTFLAEAV